VSTRPTAKIEHATDADAREAKDLLDLIRGDAEGIV